MLERCVASSIIDLFRAVDRGSDQQSTADWQYSGRTEAPQV